MDAKNLDSSALRKQEELEDITTCCICTEVYTDPKALPCIHTFCMKCLRELGIKTGKGPGDEMPCPICRRLFKIPTEGFPGLPKHFFIERLIHVSKVSDPSSVTKALCSLCLEESKEQTGTETPTADSYCVDCKYKLCEECCNEHRKFKATKNHKLMPINDYESGQNVTADLASLVCKVHENYFLDVYCTDCKKVVCAICFIEEHHDHKGSHINKCLGGFREQIENNTETMNECIAQAQIKKAELVKVKQEMQQMVESLECDVEKRKNEIKALADKHASYLLQGLCSNRQSRLKEIQLVTDDTDAYISNLESYNSYCQRLLANGSASDICSAHSDLSIRAFELQQQCQPIMERGILDFKFCFTQSELEEFLGEDCGNFIGEIEEEDEFKPKKTSKQILLAEQSKKIDTLRQENEELRKQRDNCDTQIVKLKQALEINKTAIRSLQVNNDKLKQELDVEKTNSNSLQTSNDKFLEELEICKATVKTLETNAEKLRKELETTKADEIRYKSDPVLVHTIRTESVNGEKMIFGLTILDKELFVVRDESSEVEVYDSIRFSFSRRWKLKELNAPWDIGSCNRNRCLYIFEYKGHDKLNEILSVDPNGNLIRNWSTGNDYGRLSVTDESNIILSAYYKNKLNEYSPEGELIREINLSSDTGIQYPWHAIKLTNGLFLVSHGFDFDDLHKVCLVDAGGKLKKSFGGKRGSTMGQINKPVYMCVDGNGFVMVVDYNNSQVLLLDSDLEFKREILSNEKHGLRYPFRILLDESNGHLFVADNNSNNGRIFVFDFK